MDSKLKRLAIAGAAGIAALAVVLVCFQNGIFSKEKTSNDTAGSAGSAEPVVVAQETDTASAAAGMTGGKQVGNNLKGFLSDNTFFDKEESQILLEAKDMSDHLSLLTTSVEKDLRVQVVDMYGNPVPDESFQIRLTDAEGNSSDYKDLDKDGIIYVGTLRAGDYEVSLLPIGEYKVPVNSTKVRVKDRVEYVAIDDISLLIKTEADIDAEQEDTAVTEAVEDADKTEMVQLQFGGNRQKVGIDVSKWQKQIDWEAVAASGVEFAIVRCGYRGSKTGALVEDPCFVENIRGASAAGLEVGVYFFTQAVTEAEAVEEASVVLTLIEEYDLQLPVYIDTEGANGGRADDLDVESRTKVCEAFCRTVENAGYTSGVYASRNWLNHMLNTTALSSYEIWLAEYRSIPLYEEYYTMWQHTSKGSVDGIEGNVDLDIYYY